MMFVKEESEENTIKPEPWGIKHEEQRGLMNVKEEQDVNEVEEKYQCQNAHNVIIGETSVSCSKIEKGCSQRNIQRKKVKRPFSCSQCGNAFTRKKYLNNHMSIHNRIKTFTCSECGNTFKQKRRLDEHMTIVPNGKRAFTCSECGNTFTRKESLKNHMKIHALLEGHSKRESKKPGRPSVEGGEMPQRLTERHWLRVADDRPDCVVCSDRARSKGRRQTKYRCSQCGVGLCAVPCNERYHTLKNYKLCHLDT